MGLTIHYSMSVRKKWSPETIRAKLEALRQFCMDLPVEEVSELMRFKRQGMRTRRRDETILSAGQRFSLHGAWNRPGNLGHAIANSRIRCWFSACGLLPALKR